MDGVGQRLDRRDDDRIARVDAQRVDVLHRAHGDTRVVGVAHDLVLDLLPADEASLDHHLADRAGAQAGADALAVGRLGLDDAATGPAERERRSDDRREPDLPQGRFDVLGRLDDPRRGIRLADPLEQVAERLAVLGHADGLERRPEEPDVVALEDTGFRQRHGEIESGLSAQTGEHAIGSLAGDDRLDRLDRQRLEVDDVGDLGVGHDRGRVRVDQDGADALCAQRATSLGPRVIELGGLSDDDRPAAEDQHRIGPRCRLPSRSSADSACRRDEPIEHGQRVERSGGTLRVVLDGLDRLLAVAKALDRAVVEVDLTHVEARRRRE